MGPEYFWMGGMWIFPMIMLTVLLVCIYLIFGRGGRSSWMDHCGHPADEKGRETAMDILKQRYAKGEISSDEFEQMKENIRS